MFGSENIGNAFNFFYKYCIHSKAPPGLTAVKKKYTHPDSKVHGANMGPIWGRQDPGGPYVGPMNFALWVAYRNHFMLKSGFICTLRLRYEISPDVESNKWVWEHISPTRKQICFNLGSHWQGREIQTAVNLMRVLPA